MLKCANTTTEARHARSAEARGAGEAYNSLAMNVTAKQEAQRILDALPDDASLEQIQYHLYVVQKIEAGLHDAEEGRLMSQEEVERRIAKWPER